MSEEYLKKILGYVHDEGWRKIFGRVVVEGLK